ncbi:MAG TPA: DUF1761 domain-containing protein [Casimicrobiaceae bacterium]|jgi:hypothetical protein|nr:DUF1761 domain-containing protein [Casimicrobiaceae bacterium]
MIGRRILAVVVAAGVYFVIGAMWYGHFSEAWLAGIGKTLAELQSANPGPLPYVVAFLGVLLECAVLAYLLARVGDDGWLDGARLGAMLALGLIGAQLALNYAFEARSATLWLINAGYALLGLVVAGAIIGAVMPATED